MRKNTPTYIINKLLKNSDKEKNLKSSHEGRMKIHYKQKKKDRMIANFLSETMQARRYWSNILKVLKDIICHPRFLYLVKLSFKNNVKLKTFPDIQRLKEFITSRPLYKKC